MTDLERNLWNVVIEGMPAGLRNHEARVSIYSHNFTQRAELSAGVREPIVIASFPEADSAVNTLRAWLVRCDPRRTAVHESDQEARIDSRGERARCRLVGNRKLRFDFADRVNSPGCSRGGIAIHLIAPRRRTRMPPGSHDPSDGVHGSGVESLRRQFTGLVVQPMRTLTRASELPYMVSPRPRPPGAATRSARARSGSRRRTGAE